MFPKVANKLSSCVQFRLVQHYPSPLLLTLEGSSSSCQGPTINEVATDGHDKPSMVRIHLRTFKTDQFSQGVDIYLGATGTNLCPVAALLVPL